MRNIRKSALLFGCLLFLTFLPSMAFAWQEELLILHTNDTHCNYLPAPASWRDDRAEVGGVAVLEAAVRELRELNQHVLLLDAGDMLTGTPISDLELDGFQGGAFFHLMNKVGYDAGTIGNHEFDHKAIDIPFIVKSLDHPILSANLLMPNGKLYGDAPGKVFHFGELSVGVVGLITMNLPGLLNGDAMEHVQLLPQAQAARDWFASLDEKPDLMVALTHNGVSADRRLAQDFPELDLIVGGHSHTRLREPEVEGKTLILQAGSRMKNLGTLRLVVEDGKIISSEGKLIELTLKNYELDETIVAEAQGYADQIQAEYGEVIGELAVDWRRNGSRDSNIGSWIADAIADATDSDFGLMNNGGIRKNLEAGPIKRLDIVEILPFANEVFTFELKGADLLSILHLNARRVSGEGGGIVQIGHLTARWKRLADNTIELVNPTIRGEAIDPDRIYNGASVDYLILSQSERYLGMEIEGARSIGKLIAPVVEGVIREHKTVGQEADDRMMEFKED